MMDWNEEDALAKGYDGKLLRRFLGCVRPHARWVAFTGVLLVARIATDLSAPVLLQRCIDGPMAARDLEGIRSYALFFLAAVVAAGLLEYAYSGATNRVGQRIILELRLRLFAHLQRLSVSFFDKNPVGRLNVRITNDVENLNELFTSGLVEFAADLLMIAGVITMMFVTSWKLALVTMAVTPLVLGVTLLFRKTARERYREMRLTIAKLNSTLNENINGMRTIQTFGRQATSLEGFRNRNAEYRDSAIAAMFAYSIFFPGIELLFSLGMSLLVWMGGTAILGGTLKLGAFLAFWYYVHKFFMPVREIAEKFNILQAAMASSERVFGILDTPPAVDDRPGARPAPPLRGEVEFDRVSFSYDGKTPVLRELSFRLEPGKSLAVVGLTGAGKSTLINLLLRFYDPVAGAVRVDGRDLRELELRSVRRQMGLVLQDVFLFSGTVEENLRLGEPGISRERLEAAARAVNADRFIARLPKGFENAILERGAALSSGERQLLSFARALAFDPRILVLDEATSSVDGETEQLIQDGLGRLLEGRTSLVVAHRLSTIRRCDRILVLHEGRVREEGTHAELLAMDGVYRRLHRLQMASTGTAAAPPGPLLGAGGVA
jgi:ATP-binding cassette subfamily B protein